MKRLAHFLSFAVAVAELDVECRLMSAPLVLLQHVLPPTNAVIVEPPRTTYDEGHQVRPEG